MRELETITEERENKALRDIKVSKNCSGREVSVPANQSLASLRMLPSEDRVEKISTPPGKLQKNDGFTNHGSCLKGRGDSFFGKTDSVIEVDDDVPETTNSGIRHSDSNTKDQKGEDNDVQEKCCNPMFKDIKFNIRKDPISSVSPRNNGTFLVTSSFQSLNVVDLKIVQNSMQVLETFGCQVEQIKISEDGANKERETKQLQHLVVLFQARMI